MGLNRYHQRCSTLSGRRIQDDEPVMRIKRDCILIFRVRNQSDATHFIPKRESHLATLRQQRDAHSSSACGHVRRQPCDQEDRNWVSRVTPPRELLRVQRRHRDRRVPQNCRVLYRDIRHANVQPELILVRVSTQILIQCSYARTKRAARIALLQFTNLHDYSWRSARRSEGVALGG